MSRYTVNWTSGVKCAAQSPLRAGTLQPLTPRAAGVHLLGYAAQVAVGRGRQA